MNIWDQMVMFNRLLVQSNILTGIITVTT